MRRYNADPAHETKLRFYGLDMHTPKVAVERVIEYVGKVDPGNLEAVEVALAPVRGHQAGDGGPDLPRSDRDVLTGGIGSLLERFDTRQRDYVAQSSRREWILARQHLVIVQQAVEARTGGSNLREEAMAANIQWILDTEPPGTKVVAWAHNLHVSRFRFHGGRSMGSHLVEVLGDDYIAFGFAFNRGSFQAIDWTQGPGRPGGLAEHTVGPAPEVNVGGALVRAGMPVFALDVRPGAGGSPPPAWLSVPHPMRQIGAVFLGKESMSSPIVLTDYDAILFVEETTRARPVKSASPGVRDLLSHPHEFPVRSRAVAREAHGTRASAPPARSGSLRDAGTTPPGRGLHRGVPGHRGRRACRGAAGIRTGTIVLPGRSLQLYRLGCQARAMGRGQTP